MSANAGSDLFHKHRLEALSDAVFAIVMTLLVLDLKVPHDIAAGTLASALKADSHEFFSFTLTFVIASVFWTLQHHVFDAIRDAGRESLTLTFVLLAFVSLLPFSTSLIGAHKIEPLAFELYFFNQFAIALSLFLKMFLAHRNGRVHESTDASKLRFRLLRVTMVMLSAAVGAHFVPIAYITFFPMAVGLLFRLAKRLGFSSV